MRTIVILLTTAIVLLAPALAQAQPACGQRDAIVAKLDGKYAVQPSPHQIAANFSR